MRKAARTEDATAGKPEETCIEIFNEKLQQVHQMLLEQIIMMRRLSDGARQPLLDQIRLESAVAVCEQNFYEFWRCVIEVVLDRRVVAVVALEQGYRKLAESVVAIEAALAAARAHDGLAEIVELVGELKRTLDKYRKHLVLVIRSGLCNFDLPAVEGIA